jgi:probable rRNA maturation factor
MEESDDHSSSVHIGGLSGALGYLRPVFEQVTEEIFLSHGVEKYALSITFIGDEEMTRLNRESLGRDAPTDVIAFDLSEEGLPFDSVGDVYISLDTARTNSERYRVSHSEELLRLVVHGALHLLGYTDASSAERRRMETLQEEIVGKFSGSLRH